MEGLKQKIKKELKERMMSPSTIMISLFLAVSPFILIMYRMLRKGEGKTQKRRMSGPDPRSQYWRELKPEEMVPSGAHVVTAEVGSENPGTEMVTYVLEDKGEE